MKRSESLAGLVKSMNAAKERGKAGYARSDEIFAQIRAKLAVGEELDLGDGRVFVIEDLFATKDKVWKPAGVSRFEGKITQKE